jgi:hypothetical protein
VTITDTTTNVSQRLLFTNTASGGTTSALSTSTGLFYWPDTNQLNVPNGLISTANIIAAGQVSAPTFQGNLTGTANVATLVMTASDDATNGNQHIAFSTTNNSFNAASTLRTSTNLTYNPSQALLTVQNLKVNGKVADPNRVCLRFSRSDTIYSNQTGFYSDDYVVIGWDSSANEIIIRQPTARPSVYAMGLTATSGTYMSGQNMLLSTVYDDFYFQSGTGQVDFTIISESNDLHPVYRVRVIFPSSAGTAKIAAIVEKFA